MKGVRQIPIFNNIPVLVRTSFNVPIASGKVANEYRLRRALPTLKFLQEQGARVIAISHIGEAGTETLRPVYEALSKMLSRVAFCDVATGPKAREAVRQLPAGAVIVLENLRRSAGEVANDATFARELASLADVFVEDSFDTCHRAHASIVGVPKYLPSYAGFVVEEEVRELTKALKPKSPSLAIIGGAKFSTKEPVLEALLKTYDKVFVGGALANDFLKAKGVDVGKSLVSNAPKEEIEKLLANPRLMVPIDSRIQDGRIEDAGPGSTAVLIDLVQKANTVLWNGPLGEYEKGFVESTDAVAEAIAKSNTYSVVGGGDTVAEIERAGFLEHFSFVSTGGGAMLDFLARGTLPGIAALGN